MQSWDPKWTFALPFLVRKVRPLRRRDNSYPWLKMPYEIPTSVNPFRDFSSLLKVLEVDFAISVITLFVVFNEALQKALVDKSVCVINIALLIVLSSIKNPLFDVYFNRITALLTVIFSSAVRAYLRPPALFALRFPLVMRAYLTSFALPALIFVFSMFA